MIGPRSDKKLHSGDESHHYLWHDISSFFPRHTCRRVELVGLDGHEVVVVAQVSRGGGHAEVVAGGQSHSILESKEYDL